MDRERRLNISEPNPPIGRGSTRRVGIDFQSRGGGPPAVDARHPAKLLAASASQGPPFPLYRWTYTHLHALSYLSLSLYIYTYIYVSLSRFEAGPNRRPNPVSVLERGAVFERGMYIYTCTGETERFY